jgi:hypothetical protein
MDDGCLDKLVKTPGMSAEQVWERMHWKCTCLDWCTIDQATGCTFAACPLLKAVKPIEVKEEKGEPPCS